MIDLDDDQARVVSCSVRPGWCRGCGTRRAAERIAGRLTLALWSRASPTAADVGRDRRDRRRGTASTRSASHRPTCSTGRAPRSHEPQRRRAARRHGLHVPQSRPLDRPATRGRRAPSIIVAARSYLRRRARAPPPTGRRPGSGATPGSTTTPRCAPACATSRRRIRRADHRAVAFADDNSIVDREVAHRAGLGWFGKNANLLLPGAGSWFVLGSIVTTAEYPPAAAGRRRLRNVPALPRRLPDRGDRRPGVIDASRCLSWILQKPGTFPVEFRDALGDRIYGCDDCQDVCPPSVRLGARHRSTSTPTTTQPQAWVDVLDLLDADDEMRSSGTATGTSPIVTRWVRRNALVVLGNVGDPADRARAPGARPLPCGPDPILAEHADWAAERLDVRVR